MTARQPLFQPLWVFSTVSHHLLKLHHPTTNLESQIIANMPATAYKNALPIPPEIIVQIYHYLGPIDQICFALSTKYHGAQFPLVTETDLPAFYSWPFGGEVGGHFINGTALGIANYMDSQLAAQGYQRWEPPRARLAMRDFAVLKERIGMGGDPRAKIVRDYCLMWAAEKGIQFALIWAAMSGVSCLTCEISNGVGFWTVVAWILGYKIVRALVASLCAPITFIHTSPKPLAIKGADVQEVNIAGQVTDANEDSQVDENEDTDQDDN